MVYHGTTTRFSVSLYNFRITFFVTIISIPFTFIFRVIIYTYAYTRLGSVCLGDVQGVRNDSVTCGGGLTEKKKNKKEGKICQGTLVQVGLVLEDRMIAVHHSQLSRSYYAPLFSSELSAREGGSVFFRSLHQCFCLRVRPGASSILSW